MAKSKKAAPEAAAPSSLEKMWAGAQAATATPTKAPKKDKTIWFTFKKMARIRTMASIRWAIDGLQTYLASYEAELKAAAVDEYFVPAFKSKQCPGNFKAEWEGFVVGVQLRKRSSASGLSPEELAVASRLGIPTKKNVKVDAGLMINPEHLTQQTLRALSAVIKANQDTLPADLIVPQAEESFMITTEDSIAKVFTLENEADFRVALPVVSTIAITYGNAPVAEADFDKISDILFPEEEAAA